MTSLYGIEPLMGAYGRSYTSIKVAQADFNNDKDFCMASGSYVNKPQLVEMGVTMIDFRYGKGNTKKDCLKVQTEKQAKARNK
jgi:hypothetical protein